MVARPVLAGSLALAALTGCGDGTPNSSGDQPTVTASPAPPAATTTVSKSTPATPPTPSAVRGSVKRGPVVYVSDGDTIGVTLDGTVVRIRLLGIDAPESKDPDEPVACYGPQSSARLATLLPRRTAVTVVSDPTQDTVDRFGRTLAYVFRAGEHAPINEQMLRDGAARVYVYRRNRPIRRIAAFRRAEAEAKAAGRGLWSRCPRP